ncbi:uncharacterized protein BJX67DRAFT_189651 [Aspergillus lucknowensis]|uniref:Uncharacterized protein n=1 Tax=Aspergillus lucknowensis TaxID=176173 RepID=A0ABR4LP92_9EURO
MGRLNGIFSRSSVKDSNTSSDIGRSWTLLSRPQSLTTQSPQRKTDTLREITSNEIRPTRADRDLSERCTSNREARKDCLQPPISSPASRTHQNSLGSGALEPTVFSSTSGYNSRRFMGFKTLFRSRRHRRRRLDFELTMDEDSDNDGDSEGHRAPAPTPEVADDTADEDSYVPVRSPNAQIVNEVDVRKASDTTDKSVNSNNTSITVCRRASKRMSMPITVVDREGNHPNPFDDIWEASRSETNTSNPFTEHSRTTESTGQSTSTFGSSENPFSSYPGHIIELSSSSHSSWCCPTLSGFNAWPTAADRRLATDSFNKLVSELYLDPLAIDSDEPSQKLFERAGYSKYQTAPPTADGTLVEKSLAAAEEKLQRRRDRLLGRIRTMRSTIHIRAEPSLSRTRGLRRMKTFSALPHRPCFMASLRGKPLESLARLGGYSLLTLPGDFAPTTLTLPVCFVAIMSYLRFFAPTVQNLFIDVGDLEIAIRAYDYFARQVLSAEKEKSRIHMTMRSSRMPSFLEEGLDQGPEILNLTQVLSVAFAFKQLLAGLPGGVLGSLQLYRILVNICRGRISRGPAQRTGSCLAGLSPEEYAKVRAISLAILALTSSMQLNLICGVFGLCSLLLHEAERMWELERRQHRRCSSHRLSGGTVEKLSLDQLAATLGPLLTDTQRVDEPDTFQAIQEEIESQRVVVLLIENWRSISRQLRIWERRGLDGRLHVPRAASGESDDGRGR